MGLSIDFLGMCIVWAAYILAGAIKDAVEAPKNCKVDWNPKVTIVPPEKL